MIYSPLDVDDLPYHTGQLREGMRNGCCINILFLWQWNLSVLCCPLFSLKWLYKIVSVTTDIYCAFLMKDFWRSEWVCVLGGNALHFLPSSVFIQILLLYLLLYDKNKQTKGVIKVFWIWKQFWKLWILNQIKVVNITRQSARILIGCNLLNVIKQMKLISLSCFNYVTK